MIRHVMKTAAGAACAVAILFSIAAIAGIRVEPMSFELTPSGAGAVYSLRVQNTGDSPMPVELRVERRQVLPDGETVTTPADDDFLIFPPQGVVPANGFQTFRVQYVGPPIERTVLYSVVVSQLPVDTAGAGDSGVKLLFNIGTLAAVSPANAKPDLVVTAVVPGEEGKLRITVENRGNRYARLRNGRWTFTAADGKAETLNGEALNAALPQPLIEAGSSRVIELPVSAGFDRTGARADYQLPDTR